MIRTNENITMSLLSDVTVATTTLPAVGSVVSNANIPTGAVVLTDVGLRRMSNTEYSALASTGQFLIVKGNGPTKPLLKSPVLTKGKVTITTQAHLPATQQITTVGYNGTTGSLPASNNTSYYIKIRKRDNDSANQSQPSSLFIGPVLTDSSGTQQELATLLLKNGIKNFNQEPGNGYLAVEALNNQAGSAVTIQAGADLTHLQFIHGSDIVTGIINAGGSPALGTDEVLDNISVGDYVRAGSATTVGVYKVIANTAGTATTPAFLTLEVPFQGVSTDIAYGSATVITAANAATATWGIKLTGIENAFDVNKFRNYYSNRFDVTFSLSSTLVTKLQGAFEGVGVWQKVAMDEYMTYGFEGQNEMLGVPPTPRYQFVKIPGIGGQTALTSKYSVINLSWKETIDNSILTLSPAKGSVIVYLNLEDSSGSGILDTGTANTGETLAVALGITANTLDE